MIKIFTIILVTILSADSEANEFDYCKDVIIDSVTEEAFGPHGIPYTGEVTCYRNKEKTILKSKRTFNNGKPTGPHICYSVKGDKKHFVSYDNTSRKKYGRIAEKPSYIFFGIAYFKKHYDCSIGDNQCWFVEECKVNEKRCVFTCK